MSGPHNRGDRAGGYPPDNGQPPPPQNQWPQQAPPAQPYGYAQPGGVIPRDRAAEVTPPGEFANATWDDVNRAREAERNAGYGPGEAPVVTYDQHNGPQVIQTSTDRADGLNKCPRCGATDIGFDIKGSQLVCRFCRFAWSEKNAADLFNLNSPIRELRGRQVGSAAGNIVPGVDQVVSFKCSACGAEVSIDTAHAVQARCHWCRNKLSVNEQIQNGAVPDVVLPFSLPKAEAVARISEFVSARKFFANRRFTAEFAPDNVMGVYLPYLIIDFNSSVEFVGFGEHTTRSYSVRIDDDRSETRYDFDAYRVARKFDLYVDDLTIESAADKRDFHTDRNTNNIINSIMPFDTKNAVRYDPNYLSGFTSQRRDLDVDAMFEPARLQAQDIGRYRAAETLDFYDRGVRWDQQRIDVHGERWVSAYLPVWLYSYYERKSSGKELLHYIAVNGRTGETMGSVPINTTRLWVASGVAELFGLAGTFLSALVFWR
ncbi:TFIIB-type zinc ribbon-containing protein [Mycobacterium sp. 852013-50091_SCH5140682]|uniref:TFIIB-type zinc ribbon-containing protein n=1 Tax=Mycobacterium sp. 852013-50091_SCH5140682 TaxID=1834109 RepID=UPI000A9661A2|nr:TFIIB-type zinc ribbon-containing protein [Mycobacterium sp. 852013-50091_SCH5140682]